MAMTVTSGAIKNGGTGVFIPGGAANRMPAVSSSPPQNSGSSSVRSCSTIPSASPELPASSPPSGMRLIAQPPGRLYHIHEQQAADWAAPLVGAMPQPGSSPSQHGETPIVNFVSLNSRRGVYGGPHRSPPDMSALAQTRRHAMVMRRISDSQLMEASGGSFTGGNSQKQQNAASAAAAAATAVEAASKALAAAQNAAEAAANSNPATSAEVGNALALQLALLQLQQQQLQLQQLQQEAMLQQMMSGGAPPGLDHMMSNDSRWSDTSLFLANDMMPSTNELPTVHSSGPINLFNSGPISSTVAMSAPLHCLEAPMYGLSPGPPPAPSSYERSLPSPISIRMQQVLSAPLPMMGGLPVGCEDQAGLGAFSLRPSFANCWS